MATNQDGSEVLETTEEVAEETTNETQDQQQEGSLEKETPDAEKEALKVKVEELEKKNRQLYERAKKAPSKENSDLSTRDVLYLAKADIHDEDMEEVLEIAKLRKIPVSQAHTFMKPILDVRKQERQTAAATHTKGGARGSTKVSGEDLLRQAEETGEVPDTDDGMNELFKARLARKLQKVRRPLK
jgi:hypothetical protein